MKVARSIVLAALVAPAVLVIACGDDAGTQGPVVTAGTGGSGGTGGGGASGTGGMAGSGGTGGTPVDGGSGGSAGSGRDGGGGASGGMAGDSGRDGAAGMGVDAGSDGPTVSDATPDAADARSDGGSDGPSADGGAACSSGPAMGKTCTNYCTAWFGTCQPIAMWAMTYADSAACLAACSSWADAKLCCRAEHVDNAVMAPNPNQASNHCGHAVGVAGPPACNN